MAIIRGFKDGGRRQVKKVVAATSCACFLLSAFTGCGGGESTDSNAFVIGYTATLTGDFASYGIEMREGVDLAVAEINADGGIDGKQVEIEASDDQGKPANGPVVAQEFCDDQNVKAILGYSFSSVALAAIPVLEQCGVPVVASAVTSPELTDASPYFFRTAFTDAFQGEQAGTFLAENRGLQSIAILYQQDDYGQGVANAVEGSFTSAGGEVTSSQAYQLGTNNFSTLIGKAVSGDVEALFVGGFYTEIAKIAKQARAAGVDVPIFASDGALSPNLIDIGGSDVEGLTLYAAFSADAADNASTEFARAYRDTYGKEPTSWAALAYDALYSVKEAVELGGDVSRESITQGLRDLDGLKGATGDLTFDDTGDRVGSIVFLQVRDGEFVPSA